MKDNLTLLKWANLQTSNITNLSYQISVHLFGLREGEFTMYDTVGLPIMLNGFQQIHDRPR